jgi:hypothetical protein
LITKNAMARKASSKPDSSSSSTANLGFAAKPRLAADEFRFVRRLNP